MGHISGLVAFVSRYQAKEDDEAHRDEPGADDAAEKRLERGQGVVVISLKRLGLGLREVVDGCYLREEE